MTDFSSKHLSEWVVTWAAAYPVRDAENEFLAGFVEKDSFAVDDLERLVRWKFQSMAHRRANALRGIFAEPPERLADLTRRAFLCNDDLGAMLIICQLGGVGPAMGSSLLMAQDPARYTVMDTRAISSLRALALLAPGRRDASTQDWLAYLAACRELATTAAVPLRTVDRALYQAKGESTYPS